MTRARLHRLAGVISLGCFVLALATGCSQKRPVSAEGQKAPEFALPGLDGTTVRLSDYSGKVVLIDFWATWCPPCRASIPHLVDLQRTYGTQGFAVIGISLDEQASDVSEFLSRTPVNYVILMADEATRMAYGGVSSIPQSFLVDRKGIIRERYLGYTRGIADQMGRAVADLLKEGT